MWCYYVKPKKKSFGRLLLKYFLLQPPKKILAQHVKGTRIRSPVQTLYITASESSA